MCEVHLSVYERIKVKNVFPQLSFCTDANAYTIPCSKVIREIQAIRVMLIMLLIIINMCYELSN